ncbi:MAG: uracil-DNA glycosylase [Rhodospirillaceae bacterium]|jgi:uracil-DNA glycosylase family 4|nr:uracil-DNA glycosylase [Rhodospirillaceae bacterium]
MTNKFLPEHNCNLCPRLVTFREEWKIRNPCWHNAPVSSFGSLNAMLLIVGLAPGLRGANATGRPFTGDYAGNLLYTTLINKGYAKGIYNKRSDDDLKLINCRITNAVRCVPPINRPTSIEGRTCGQFLTGEIAIMPKLHGILAIGNFAHNAVLAALNCKKSIFPFTHNATHHISDQLLLIDSYHCSRLNINTGRLTESMFHQVFNTVDTIIKEITTTSY